MATGNDAQMPTFTEHSGNSDGNPNDVTAEFGESEFFTPKSPADTAKEFVSSRFRRSTSNVRTVKKDKSARVRPEPKDYREAIKGAVQVPASVLLVKYPADACVLLANADSLAEVGQQLAEHDERIAALLEKVTEVGPYGAAAALIVTMGAQFMVNHGIIKPGIMNTVPPDVLIAQVSGVPMDAEKKSGE